VFFWKAWGKNLADRPVSLYFAEKGRPWKLLVDGLPRKGKFVWDRPQGFPDRVFLRAQARDIAGKAVNADTHDEVLLNFDRKNR
jgi:hypothetical protein